MFTLINWLLKSMNRVPSGVQKYTPSARATAIGATLFCAVHSKIVCFFDSSTISSLVIVIGACARLCSSEYSAWPDYRGPHTSAGRWILGGGISKRQRGRKYEPWVVVIGVEGVCGK